MKRIMQAPEMRAQITALGLILNDSSSTEDMRSYIASEQLKWGAMVKQLGLEGTQ
jgi:tripartite-type tricarboxylate transporter receptor subunit TctC